MKKKRDFKSKKSVALRYGKGDAVPKVIAKGRGRLSERIVEKGKEEGIYVHKDEKLVKDLIDLELYQEIPEELYDIVAKVILFVYSIDKEKGDSYEK